MNQALPKKLPPPLAPINVPTLPIVGYLEQSVSTSLQEALGALGRFKPKYPYKSLPSSASVYLGLYLKCMFSFLLCNKPYTYTYANVSAKNPKAKEWTRSKFENRLSSFKKDCELMKTVADRLKLCGEDFVKPEERPEGLDSGLERLKDLRE